MAKSFAVGQTRVNPNTFMTEVWNGTKWDSGLSTITNTTGTYTIAPNGMNSMTVSSRPTISATERELIFEFLKRNLRVAEYRDSSGKIENVELQIRLDEGYSWEPIRREKIYQR
jgi:hypothetical protein